MEFFGRDAWYANMATMAHEMSFQKHAVRACSITLKRNLIFAIVEITNFDTMNLFCFLL